jgi:hypothetical protein
MTEVALEVLYPQLSPEATTPQATRLSGPSRSTQGRASRFAWIEPDRTTSPGPGIISLKSSEAFRQIGHSMFALLFAIIGGNFARHRYRITAKNRPVIAPPTP